MRTEILLTIIALKILLTTIAFLIAVAYTRTRHKGRGANGGNGYRMKELPPKHHNTG